MRNLKKVISSVAALAIVASSASAFAGSFPDVDASASYSNAVETLTALGVINGDDNGLFNPDNQVTRAEFTKMAVEALGEGEPATAQTTSQFADAANTTIHWAAGYIAQGVSDGFINGYDDTTFGPDDQVTYAQACKMLVAAIGYTTYAENQGGYPSGYVAQASQLGITSGVSATNDTNLTRAQVATLIYNSMDVPLCVIDSWESTSTLTGVVQTPVLKKMDGKENRDYETLLTDRHDAYRVKGRVTVTSKGGSASGLEKDEVTYQVEVADNFDDIMGITKGEDTYTFKVGDTNAADLLFEYTEAIVQKDDDADEYTILSITQYGNSKTVTFAADDLADDDSAIGTDYVKNAKIPVYKTESSSSTTKYDLSTDNGVVDTVVYVNGVEAGVVTDQMINDYILENSTGTVTLVDKTSTGSTSTDGKYEYIMVDFYVDAVVDSVTTSSAYARVSFKFTDTPLGSVNRMQWDPDDEDVDITFTLEDAEIAYTDLEEYDVLSIAWNVVDYPNTLTDVEYYDVKVSRNTVTGNVTSRDGEDNTVRVDGSDYDVINAYDVTSDVELSTEYTLYLDSFGYVAYIDEGSSEKNYGVIVAMYQSAGNDYPTVRFITSNAEVVAYECKDQSEADAFYNYATGTEAGYQDGGFTKSTNRANIIAGETVCTYKLSGGKVKFDKSYKGAGGTDLEYKASSLKLGSYTLSESATKIIDMDDYMSDTNSGSTVGTLSISSFEDEATYTAYLFDKSSNTGEYRFAIVFEGTSSIRSESSMAVVKKVVGTTDQDGTTCTELLLCKDGNDDVSVLFEGDDTGLIEGSVVAYVVGNDGYAETYYEIYSPVSGSGYTDILANTLKQSNFSDVLKNVQDASNVGISTTKYPNAKTPKYATTTSKDVVLYFGIVSKKSANNLELFVAQENGQSSLLTSDLQSFSVAGANSYIYEYGNQNKNRVSVGSVTQNSTIFNNAYVTNDKNEVKWDLLQYDDPNGNNIQPALALVKVVDGDVLDVVYYTAP